MSSIQAPPVPNIVTELPGPRARAHIEFDHAWTSPSLPRAYPIVPVRGEGCAVEDIDGNVFLDFAAGIAVNSTGHAHPRVSAAIAAQAAELIHFSASDFYLPIYAHAAERLARIAPMKGPNRAFIGNSGAEAVEAALKLARYHTGRQNVVGVPRGLPRPHDGRPQPHRQQGQVPRPLRAVAARRLPRPVRERRPRRARAARLQAPDAGRRVRRRDRGADPGRGRLRRPRRRVPPAPARDLRSPRDPPHRRRGPVRCRSHRQDVGDRALGRRARHPAHRQGDRLGDADRGDDRPGRGHGLGSRVARLDVRRQPGRPAPP